MTLFDRLTFKDGLGVEFPEIAADSFDVLKQYVEDQRES